MNATELRDTVRTALDSCRERRDAFVARGQSEGAEASDAVAAFDALLLPLDGLSGRVGLWSQVHPDGDVREACLELEQELSAFKTELSLDRELFDQVSRIDLDAVSEPRGRRVVEHALRDFRRSGVDRDEATRERVKKLEEELVAIGQEFDRNIITGGRTLRIAGGHAALDGLPRDFLDAHPEDEDGSVTLNTDPNVAVPLMKYAVSPELRRDYWLEYTNRAMPENLAVLDRLLAKRHELATLLGYATWADYVTEDKMIGSGAAAGEFVQRVIDLARGRAEAEHAELLEERRETEPAAEHVYEWEAGYLTERVKARRYGFDSQEVRPYFAYDKVRDGVLATSAALYGVEFRKNDEVETWHPSVECYDIVDGGEVVARFYLDMHPRENKFKHAAMFHLSQGVSGGERDVLAEACLVCNFPEPREGDPALLLHEQVKTYFHEFGHLLHHLFGGRQPYLAFSGIATEWDFVEVPSQMYEEWAWDAGVLARFATHHETGEPIPTDLVARMRAADEYGKGLSILRQMSFARLSLRYYEQDPSGLDTTAEMIRTKTEVNPFYRNEEGSHMHASFGHLHGYSAMYYTYMWSLVIAKDVFSRFQQDLMSADTAREYREKVLAPGGSKDASDLVREFLGREYGYEAFESWVRA